jgi:hypothetical protein
LKYWLSKSPEERVATVDYLRRQLWKRKSAEVEKHIRIALYKT